MFLCTWGEEVSEKREGEEQKSPVHWFSSQIPANPTAGLARSKPGAGHSILVSYVGVKDPGGWARSIASWCVWWLGTGVQWGAVTETQVVWCGCADGALVTVPSALAFLVFWYNQLLSDFPLRSAVAAFGYLGLMYFHFDLSQDTFKFLVVQKYVV